MGYALAVRRHVDQRGVDAKARAADERERIQVLALPVVVIVLIPKVLCRECVKEVEQAKARGPLYQAKIRKQLIPLVFVGRLFMVGAAAWVAYEIAKANE